MSRRFLLFSGHNDRAVIALCRYFHRAGLPFVIVAAGQGDAIHQTAWREHVVFNRIDKVVDATWLRQLADSLDGPLVYCPTTEFINDYVLVHREALQGCGLVIGLPERKVYAELTGKASSQKFMTGISPELSVPATQSMFALRAPCVLKPTQNVKNGKVLYPLLCRSPRELDMALDGLDRSAYFAQDFIVGQSHYLCGYLTRDGRHASFWQTNCMQQPAGKSIVLAKVGGNPGIDEAALFKGLHARGYHGPFMMEVIASSSAVFYIEVNPRFWGPLQLALDACPDILHLFAQDHGFDVQAWAPGGEGEVGTEWYAWAYGAGTPGCVLHPAARAMSAQELNVLLLAHDVYGHPDTEALHACF